MSKLLHNLATSLLLASAALPARAADPALITGRLDNGLTYYIYPNKTAPGRADFFLSRGIGSLVEREDERGLAHFLEHIAFNGTRHFPGNSIITWLENNGVKFGADLNAHTAIDETVYNISRVPVTRRSALDSCLLILRDWSCDLTLDDKEIDAERGVIKSEWRHRNTASNRLLQRAAPRIYPGSLYGRRLPMGLMEVVENFQPQTLRDFYRRNYTPDNEAIIVVGDVDAVYVEQKIRSLMKDMPAGQRQEMPGASVEMGTPLNVVALSDPEMSVESIQLMIKHPRLSEPRAEMLSALLTTLLLPRLDALELNPDSPVGNIGIGDNRFMLSEGTGALMLRGNITGGDAPGAAKALHTELLRALRHGFSAGETDEARRIIADELKSKLAKAEKRTNTDIASAISRSWLKGEELNTPLQDYEEAMKALEALTAADATKYLREILHPDGTDVVILRYSRMPGEEGARAEKAIADAFLSASSSEIAPFNAPLPLASIEMTAPVAGKVTKTGEKGPFDTEIITLSNGLKVYLRPSAEKPGQIFLRGAGPGGLSQNYSDADAPSLKLLNDVMAVSGAGNMDNAALRRFLNGKDLKVSAMVSNTEETIEFASSPGELENAFRLLYLKATAPKRDDKAFTNLMVSRRQATAGRLMNPVQSMGDSITMNVYSRHPLSTQPDSTGLGLISYDHILEVFADRFSDFSDFTFYMLGDFERDSVIPLLARYIAPLPVKGRIERPRDIGYRFSPSLTIDFSKEMETPVAVVYQFRHTPAEYSLQDVIMASATGQLLKARLLADLREKRGITYSITTHGAIAANMNGTDSPQFMMPVYVKVDPAHTDEAALAIDETLADMAGGEITDAELDKVKEYMLKSVRDSRRENAYWLMVLQRLGKTGLDMDTDYEKKVGALTPAGVSQWLSNILAAPETIRITMRPRLNLP